MKHKGEPINVEKCYKTFDISCNIHTFFCLIFKLLSQNNGHKKEAAPERQPQTKNQF